MIDEHKYPTMRFLRCRRCGNIFVESLSGARDCPDCQSDETDLYHPPQSDEAERSGGER